MGGMPGYVAPPPGLMPPDYSIWNMPPLEDSLPKGLPASLPYRPPVGRAEQLRATLDRMAPPQRAPGPLTLPHLAPVQQDQTHQMVPPLCQLPPSSSRWPATPYKQVVQPPSKSTGLGVTSMTQLTNLLPLVVRMLRAMRDKVPEAEMTTASLPVTPGNMREVLHQEDKYADTSPGR